MTEVVLMSDPKVAAVPVRECGEQLVDVRGDGRLLVDERKRQDSADAFAHLRAGVLRRLVEAQDQLPGGMRLLFVEGYRPPASNGTTSTRTPTNCVPVTRTGPRRRSVRRPAATCPRRRSPRTAREQPST